MFEAPRRCSIDGGQIRHKRGPSVEVDKKPSNEPPTCTFKQDADDQHLSTTVTSTAFRTMSACPDLECSDK